MKRTKILAVVPARSGSKRFVGKNKRLFSDNPLFYYSCRFGQLSPHIDQVVISTDDNEILAYASEHCINAIKRPKELCTDEATSAEAVTHALIEQERIDGCIYDWVVLLQVTNPLRPKYLLSEPFELLETVGSDVNAMFTVSEMTHKFGKLTSNKFKPENYSFGQRSQDIGKLYFENGLLYLTSRELLLSKGEIISDNNTTIFIKENYAAVDIDYEYEFLSAEAIFSVYDDFAYLKDHG